MVVTLTSIDHANDIDILTKTKPTYKSVDEFVNILNQIDIIGIRLWKNAFEKCWASVLKHLTFYFDNVFEP